MAADIKFYLGIFDDEHKLLSATRAAQQSGFDIYDCYTPYAVHGLDQAMGLAHSKLGWIALFGGLLGFVVALHLQIWTSAYNWPINVGGKPYISLPAFIPITFELTVLLCGLIGLGGMITLGKLGPTLRPSVIGKHGCTSHRFILALRSYNQNLDLGAAHNLLLHHGAMECKWYEES